MIKHKRFYVDFKGRNWRWYPESCQYLWVHNTKTPNASPLCKYLQHMQYEDFSKTDVIETVGLAISPKWFSLHNNATKPLYKC
jgi:hypothetical protein